MNGTHASQNPLVGAFVDRAVKYLLLALALTPIITFRHSLVYPYTFSKIIFFRSIIEIIVILLVSRVAFFSDGAEIFMRLKDRFARLLRTPIIIAILAFGLSSVISTIFAVDRYHAFWGNVERGGGLFDITHYFLFLVVAVLVFEKKDWLFFINTSVVVGFLMMLYAWLQWFGIEKFPFSLIPTGRPGSFLDNPAFFATYLLFLAMFAAASFLSAGQRSGWRFFALVVAAWACISVFLTNTRGAIAGLVIGAVFLLTFLLARKKEPIPEAQQLSSRRIALLCLVALIFIGAVFVVTREASFWDRIPGLNRIADFSFQDSSLLTRFDALKSSLKAFSDKPFFGWGVDNYQVGHNKHFNPDVLLYEDGWFDRAHNIIAEVAVTQGIVGLAAYIAVFAALFAALFVRTEDELFGKIRPYLLAGVIAYLVQNLFLFDHPVGRFMLVAAVGLTLSFSVRKDDSDILEAPAPAFETFVPHIFGWAIVVLGAVVLYLYSVIPFYQSRLFVKTLEDKVGEKALVSVPKFLRPYNYLQPTIRFRFLEILTENNLMRDPQFDSLTTMGLSAVEEVVSREPLYDPRNYIKLAEAYNEKGKERPQFFKEAEKFARRGLELSPNRPSILYPLSFALAGQDKFEEAIEVARQTVELNPRLAKSHFNLGLQLALAGKSRWDEAYEELKAAIELDGASASSLGSQDKNNLAMIFKEMITAYILREDADRLIKIAELYLRLGGAPVDNLRTIVDLAKNKRWDILKNAVRMGQGTAN